MQITIKKKLILLTFFFLITPILSLAEQSTLIFNTINGSFNAEPSKQILAEAYQHIGMKIEVEYLPGERALRMSNSGNTDGELQRILHINKKYPNLVMVPVSIGAFGGYVFTKNTEFQVNGWESLKPYKIGIVRGVKFTEKGTKGMKVFQASNVVKLFNLLNKGRIDILVTAHFSGLNAIKKTGVKGVKILSPPVEEYALYHYLHKKNADLIPKLIPILKKMEKEGRIKEIWDQYARTLK